MVIRGVMATTQAITDLQMGLALNAILHPSHELGHEVFRGKQRGEKGSILFDIQTKELQAK